MGGRWKIVRGAGAALSLSCLRPDGGQASSHPSVGEAGCVESTEGEERNGFVGQVLPSTAWQAGVDRVVTGGGLELEGSGTGGIDKGIAKLGDRESWQPWLTTSRPPQKQPIHRISFVTKLYSYSRHLLVDAVRERGRNDGLTRLWRSTYAVHAMGYTKHDTSTWFHSLITLLVLTHQFELPDPR